MQDKCVSFKEFVSKILSLKVNRLRQKDHCTIGDESVH